MKKKLTSKMLSKLDLNSFRFKRKSQFNFQKKNWLKDLCIEKNDLYFSVNHPFSWSMNMDKRNIKMYSLTNGSSDASNDEVSPENSNIPETSFSKEKLVSNASPVIENFDSSKLGEGESESENDPLVEVNEGISKFQETLSEPSTVFQQENSIRAIQLKLISPKRQLKQLQRILPNGSIVGQITNSQTLNYKTLKPEKDGLFCERIFGPTQDYLCACGKKQKSKNQQNYCPDCEVEYTIARVRRYRLGFIRLGVPMAHIWYLKGRPSYIGLLLDMKKKHAESLAYGSTCIFQNYSPEFGLRIQKLRTEFNDNFYDLRQSAKTRPGPFTLYSQGVRESLRAVLPFVDHRGDDFWVTSKGRFDWFPTDWLKRNFLRKKPFFQVPLITDQFNLIYRGYPEYLYSMENYLFPLKRTYGSRPINKYKKAIPNSMICYESSQNIELMLTGGLAFQHLFSKIDCYRITKSLTYDLLKTRLAIIRLNTIEYKRAKRKKELTRKEKKERRMLVRRLIKHVRRIKLFRTFWRTGARPEWMFISVLPVLPPDLRPIIKMSNDQLAVSDLNRLYQAVFHRNRNMKFALASIYLRLGLDINKLASADLDETFLDTHYNYNYQAFRFSTSMICFQQNLLQQAVDALFENGKGGSMPVSGSNNRPFKSLSDILKGKKGRFRQNLLGKRVDYSGRSVIVVGPKLKLYQCGLPKELALELFQSLLIRKMMNLKLVKTIVSAKQLIRIEHPIIWSLLSEVMTDFPVLLNRAPTLHRLGVQAFLPKLVRGKAILLHPLVCPAFNADFDGDQMGVHLPLSVEAKSEAWSLMLSTQNMLSPATGDPLLVPSQDMVLGCYYLTTINPNQPEKQNKYFSNLADVYKAYVTKQLHPHEFIWLRWKKPYYTNQSNRKLFEIRLRLSNKEKIFITSTDHKTYFLQHNEGDFRAEAGLKDQFLRTTVGRVLINQTFQDYFAKSTVKYLTP